MSAENPTDEELQKSRKHLEGILDDLAGQLLYYNRKEDDVLPVGRIELLVKRGVISKEEIFERINAGIGKHL